MANGFATIVQGDSDLSLPREHVALRRDESPLTRPKSAFERPKSAFERDTGAQQLKPHHGAPTRTSAPPQEGNHFAVDLSKIRALPGLEKDDPETSCDLNDLHTAMSLQGLTLRLRSCDEEEREEALATLGEIVDGAFGEDGVRLGEDLRNVGAISLLAELLADSDEFIREMSLRVLGNLCSDAVDARSAITKRLLLPHALPIFSFAYSGDESVLLLACGALQNLTADTTWARKAVAHGVQRRLEQLVASFRGKEDGHLIVRYASGALRNIAGACRAKIGLAEATRALISQRADEHRLEALEQERAKQVLTRAILSVAPERRRRWQELGRAHKKKEEEERQQLEASDTASVCSSSCSATSAWSYGSRPPSRPSSAFGSRPSSAFGSRPSSACSQDSRASGSPLQAVRAARSGEGSGGISPRARPASAFARSGGGGGMMGGDEANFYGLRALAGSPLHAIRGRLYHVGQ